MLLLARFRVRLPGRSNRAQSAAGCGERILILVVILTGRIVGWGQGGMPEPGPVDPGIIYTNSRVPGVPWSIHVVQIPRSPAAYEIHSAHADKSALGLSTLSDQIQETSPAAGRPVAAVNGDYYQRGRTYAGDPRGLQIVDGEVISAPTGGACFWIDVLGQPHATEVESRFHVVWPDGSTNAFGLNEERRRDQLVLYSSAVGSSTHTEGGRELVLEKAEGPWLPLRVGRIIKARVGEVRESGNTSLSSNSLVLSMGPIIAGKLPKIEVGSSLILSTATAPDLRGAKTAIGGGPVLVRDGKRQKFPKLTDESYEFSSMSERHPRSAIGWNARWFYLLEVDGRQRHLSVGMTLEELSGYLVTLGCEGAMNLDGGGSATLWWNGRVRNNPCDGDERPIANSLIVVKRPSPPGRPESSRDGTDR